MLTRTNEVVLSQFEQYLTQISLSPKTIASYLADLSVFLRWATRNSRTENFSIVQIMPEQIRAYRHYLLNDLGRAPTTVNRHLQAIRKYCSYIKAVNLTTSNAAAEVSLVSIEDQETPEILTQSQTADFINAANGTRHAIAKRDMAILQLLVKAGLRVAEVVNLQEENVIFDYPGVHLSIQDSRGQGWRDIPLALDVCRALKEYLSVRPKAAATEAVFLTQEGNPLSARTVQRIVSRCARQAQLQGVTAQLLRRTYAMNLLQETGQLSLVSARLGHQTPQITLRYLNLSELSANISLEA